MVCSNHVFIRRRFRDIATYLAYVAACGLEQPFSSVYDS